MKDDARQVVEAIAKAVDEAVEFYREAHIMLPGQEREARSDFERFFVAALRLGVTGIRWNFNGCILCPQQTAPTILYRVLVMDGEVIKAAGGRGFGTVLCVKHVPLGNDRPTMRAAALQRLREQPPP